MSSPDHPIFARAFALLSPLLERSGIGARRRQLVASLHGTVVEVGAGSGATFGAYPPAVDRVVAIEPNPYLRVRAARRATTVEGRVRVVAAVAERLPLADASVDAAVSVLTWCSVDDPRVALGELARVLADGAPVVFLEHVRATDPRAARLQQAIDRAGWPRLAGGCHLARSAPTLLADAGFTIEFVAGVGGERSRRVGLAPHVWGRAVRQPRPLRSP